MNIELVSTITIAIGVILAILSIILYFKRTGDKNAIIKLWGSKDGLSQFEIILNRVGIIVVAIGFLAPKFIS